MAASPRPAPRRRVAGKKSAWAHLLYHSESAWEGLKDREQRAIMALAEDYKAFLRRAKTERECVRELETALRRRGFTSLERRPTLKSKDRIYKVIKGRALVAAVIGSPDRPWRIAGAHLDSPRLDLKPNPLYEDADLAMLQTHYYGGIKKYQWVNVPLSLHAVVHTRRGVRTFVIGEAEDEPRFLIPDMPPHLAREQLGKPAREAVGGEQLRIVVGNRPVANGADKDKIKVEALRILHDAYGLVERDLLSADITFVPAAPPSDVGFDRSLIAAYGHDDRACVFGVLNALLDPAPPSGVAVGLFVDKEEIGSVHDTGAQSRILENFTIEVGRKLGLRRSAGEILEGAAAVSADVTEAANPNYRDVSDARNVSRLGSGVAVEKYGGGGGKYDTSEASSEYMSWLLRLLDDRGIRWQTGELGKLDQGGGGTIAMYLSRYGMDAIDAGPPLLSMHSPQELLSKVDLYMACRTYAAFLRA